MVAMKYPRPEPGTRFGRWIFLRAARLPWDKNSFGAACVCDCGNEGITRFKSLIQGRSKSCGCIRIEMFAKVNTTHGKINTREYHSWHTMRSRCNTPTNTNYKWYGARGIKICKRWERFENFLADMGPRPPKHSLDRINNDGDYEPSNCRWATSRQQVLNSRTTHLLTKDGRTQCLTDWANEFGITTSALSDRIRNHGEAKALAMGAKTR